MPFSSKKDAAGHARTGRDGMEQPALTPDQDKTRNLDHVCVTPDVILPAHKTSAKRRGGAGSAVVDAACVEPQARRTEKKARTRAATVTAEPATKPAGTVAPTVEVLGPGEGDDQEESLEAVEQELDGELDSELDNELDGELGGDLDEGLDAALDSNLDASLDNNLRGNLAQDMDEGAEEDLDDDMGGRLVRDREYSRDDEEEHSPEEGSYEDSYEASGNSRSYESTLPAPADSRLPSVRDNFQLYVREVCRYPLLKPEEEHELAVRFRDTQDKQAAFKLISSHLRLVVKIAMDFQRRWMQNVLDLVQEGNVGLIHALYKFDPDKGIKFSYYSSFWIKAYILKFIMDNFRMVKIGTTQVQRKLFFNLNRERQKLIAQGFNPDAEMLSLHLGVSKNDILEMEQRLSSSDVSLNVPVSDESDGASRIDFLPALDPGIEESIATEEISDMLHAKLKTLLPKLSEKELYILNNRLFTDSPETLREIGERYNITRERVRQLEIRLLEKIKKHLAGDIKDFSEVWIQS